MEDGGIRRRPEDHEELARLLEEAGGFIEERDLRGANETLKRAGVKAATMWGGVGRPTLPEPARELEGLIGEVQSGLTRPERPIDPLRQSLSRLRARFDAEARRDSDGR